MTKRLYIYISLYVCLPINLFIPLPRPFILLLRPLYIRGSLSNGVVYMFVMLCVCKFVTNLLLTFVFSKQKQQQQKTKTKNSTTSVSNARHHGKILLFLCGCCYFSDNRASACGRDPLKCLTLDSR